MQLTRAEVSRFFDRIAIGGRDECWLWSSPNQRYGVFTIVRDGKRVAQGAHRIAWELANNAVVPDGLQVLHRCDVPRCVNPSHLFAGSQSENIRDCAVKGRHVSSSRKLTDDQVAAVRALAADGQHYTEIAAAFGISRTTASYYARGLMKRGAGHGVVPLRINQWRDVEGASICR